MRNIYFKSYVALLILGLSFLGCDVGTRDETSLDQTIPSAPITPSNDSGVSDDKTLETIGDNQPTQNPEQTGVDRGEDMKNYFLDITLFMKHERYDFAIETCEQILKIDPNNQDAKAKLILAQRKLKLANLTPKPNVENQANASPQNQSPNIDMQKLLKKTVSIEFEGIHIENACKFITDMHGLPIIIDWEAVENPGSRSPGVNSRDNPNYVRKCKGVIGYIHQKDVALSAALKAMLQPLGLDYKVYSDYVWVSSPANLNS